MSEWIVPVVWESCGFVKVKADTATEACQAVHDNPEHYPIPFQSEYIEDSYGLPGEVEEISALSEIYTTEWKSGRWGQDKVFLGSKKWEDRQ